MRWGATLALATLVTAALGLWAWSNYSATKTDRKIMSDLRRQIAEIEQRKSANEAVLNRPENQDARDQARFWNDVIDQKAFSWTHLFSDMEKIMPARAFVISVKPTLEPDKRLKLELTIGGEKHENAVDLVRNMEGSEHFRQPLLIDESAGSASRGQNFVEFHIETYYMPAGQAGPQRTSAREGAL
jgi:hypothetical protein